MPPSTPKLQQQARRYLPQDKDQRIVQTPYGRGLVIRTRPTDSMYEVQLTEWVQTTTASRRVPPTLYTPTKYPSVPPMKGDDVLTPYGRGKVTDLRPVVATSSTSTAMNGANGAKKSVGTATPTMIVSVQLETWRLAHRCRVMCHLQQSQVEVVRKHTLNEMSVPEKIERAQELKQQANKHYTKKRFKEALTVYGQAVEAVRRVEHDHQSTNELRADLIVVMVTCSNNAATCSMQLSHWDHVIRYSKNALVLLDALYGKRGMKIHSILNKEGTPDAKLFGEWRVKPYWMMGRAHFERNEHDEAVATIKKGLEIAYLYIDNKKTEEQSPDSLQRLHQQERQLKKVMVQALHKQKQQKQTEKKRAKAMFGGGDDSSTKSSKSNGKKNGMTKRAETKDGKLGEKKVSFSDVNHVKEYSPADKASAADDYETDEDDEPPKKETYWYQDHYEALILTGVVMAGAALTNFFLSSRKSIAK